MATIVIPPIWRPLTELVRPGPMPRMATLIVVAPFSVAFFARVMAVVCAAMLVPFLVFLNPSRPQEWYAIVSPVFVARCMMVLFLVVFM